MTRLLTALQWAAVVLGLIVILAQIGIRNGIDPHRLLVALTEGRNGQ